MKYKRLRVYILILCVMLFCPRNSLLAASGDGLSEGGLELEESVFDIAEAEPVLLMDIEPLSAAESVNSFEGFSAWLDFNKSGQVELGGDIVINSGEYLYIESGTNVTVITNGYCILVSGGIMVESGAKITGVGNGSQAPFIKVLGTGTLTLEESSEIAATGDNFQTVWLESSGNLTKGYPFRDFGTIRATGANSAALYSEDGIDARYLDIQISGANSAAVMAGGNAKLYLCKITAENGGQIVSATDAVLDTCAVSCDIPPNADVINRKITWLSQFQSQSPNSYIYDRSEGVFPLYTAYPEGADEEGGYYYYAPAPGEAEQYIAYLGSDGEDERKENILILWNNVAESMETADSTVDRSVLRGALVYPYSCFDIVDDVNMPVRFVSDVFAPDVPRFTEYMILDIPEMPLSFEVSSYPPTWENPGIRLLRSDDEGQTWFDYKDAMWGLSVSFDELDGPTYTALFKLDYGEIGETAPIRLFADPNYVRGGHDGDRDHGDRMVSFWKPSPPTGDIDSNPDPNETNSDDSKAESSTSGGGGGGSPANPAVSAKLEPVSEPNQEPIPELSDEPDTEPNIEQEENPDLPPQEASGQGGGMPAAETLPLVPPASEASGSRQSTEGFFSLPQNTGNSPGNETEPQTSTEPEAQRAPESEMQAALNSPPGNEPQTSPYFGTNSDVANADSNSKRNRKGSFPVSLSAVAASVAIGGAAAGAVLLPKSPFAWKWLIKLFGGKP